MDTFKEFLKCFSIFLVIAVVIISISLSIRFSRTSNIETISYNDTIIHFYINDISDIIYKPNTKTYWVELNNNECHYVEDSVASELIWHLNNPDSIHHDFYIDYNIDGDSEIRYME